MRFATTEGAAFSSRAAAEKLPSRATLTNELMLSRLLIAARVPALGASFSVCAGSGQD
jgi:hypothetical protein